jgi:hypothetical protein
VSELTVESALLSRKWEVSRPLLDEKYDILVREPGTPSTDFKRVQIKTIRRRVDRNNEMVIYATNGRGVPYIAEDIDYIAGVEGLKVYLVECTGLQEYWASDEAAARKWRLFDVQ